MMSFNSAALRGSVLIAFLASVFAVRGLAQTNEAIQPSAPLKSEPAAPAAPVAQQEITVSKPAALPQPSVPEPPAPSPYSSSQTAPSVSVSGDYVLRPGDALEMIVYKEPDLTVRTKIGKDGRVQLPLLGEVRLAGLTLSTAMDQLTRRYDADYLVAPQIYLNILAYSTVKFTIIGQVGKPGTYEYSESEPLDLLQAIGMAGGFTRIADRGHVVVKRREAGSVRTIKVNAKKLTDSAVDRFVIQTGDVINVGESWF